MSTLADGLELTLARVVDGLAEDPRQFLRGVEPYRVLGGHEVEPPLRLALERRGRSHAVGSITAVAIVDKRRYADDEDARAINLIGDVKGKVALIIDDEVASGGTLLEATRFVLERGAVAVEACAVHAVLSGRAIERIEASPLRQLVPRIRSRSRRASASTRSTFNR
jgi:hypothetical protein